jgi:type I restriction enzyme S subunit
VIKGVPEGWEYVSVTAIANVRYGKNLPTDKLTSGGLYPVYGAAKIIGMYEQASITERTIITGCRGSVGQMAITKPKCFVTNNSFTIKPNRPKDFFWLYHNLCLRGFNDVVGGSAQPQITLEGMASAKIILPISELRDGFFKIAMPMYEQIWALQESVERIILIRDALLPRLISGKLSIENLNIQFPPGMEDHP